MIGSFPQPIPGETFESLVARLSRRITASGAILQGRYYQGASAEGRFSPEMLVANLAVPDWLPLRRLLEENTPLPVVRPFLDQEDCERITKQLTVAERSSTITRSLSRSPRFCPECRTTELEGLAEVGWQVLHQFRWFWRCQAHRIPLWQMPLARKAVATEIDTGCRNRADLEVLKAIERDTKWLIGARVPPLGRLRWREFHRNELTKRFGVRPPFTSRDLFPLAHRIRPRAREWLQLSMISHLDNWLLTTVRHQHGTTDPLLHLATLRICGVRVHEAVRRLTAAGPAPAHVTPEP
ncbi:MAG TPA: TniQ family protein [Lacunisphaera sp.]|nr:TniQ family protein [Lacunisphaera sp.]